MAIIAATATERLRRYRQSHRIEVDRSPEWNRCDHDGITVYQVLSRRWQHDMNQVRALEVAAAAESVR